MEPQDPKKDPFEVFLETYSQDLLDVPDADMLDGDDGAAAQAAGLRLLDSAKKVAAARRLKAARKRLDELADVVAKTNVSADEARAYLRQAANDPRYTLAARELGEMSDADALALYAQLKTLEKQKGFDEDASS